MSLGQVLVLQLARLGDLVQTWPLLRQLRRAYPGARLGLLADRRLQGLRSIGPPVDDWWEMDPEGLAGLAGKDMNAVYAGVSRKVNEIRAQGYEVVFNLNFSRLSLLLAYLLGNRTRGHLPGCGGREFFREPWLALVFGLAHARKFNRLHLSDVFRHLAWLPPPALRPPAPQIPRGEPLVAVQLGTRHPRRTWPLESFIRLAGLLVGREGARLWLLGTARERPLGEALRQALTPPQRERVLNLQGQTDLEELAARLQAAHLLVSGDTGTLHLAAALGVRTLGVFFGPASCGETGPYGEGHYVIQAEPPCHPCQESQAGCAEPFCPAMIPAEAVAGLARDLCRGEFPPPGLQLPAGTRVYRSSFDDLGVTYLPLTGGWRFQDLVGLAYRQAGARLLGDTSPGSPALEAPISPEIRLSLGKLAAALHNGFSGSGLSPEVTEALAPLKAFRRQIEQQRSRGWLEAGGSSGLQVLQTGFQTELERLSDGGAASSPSPLEGQGGSLREGEPCPLDYLPYPHVPQIR